MDKEIAVKWVAALRSGEYQQTKRILHDGQGFCCLGVLCDLFPGREWGHTAGSKRHYCYAGSSTEYALVPAAVQRWADLSEQNPFGTETHTLAELNDELGWSFSRIANLIEQEWERL